MTATTDFISELVRAANEIERLSKGQRSFLLLRGFRMIRDMRIQSGTRPIHEQDGLRKLEIAALLAENGTSNEAILASLSTAEMDRLQKTWRPSSAG
jgi:hypothetical protein